MLQTVRDLDVLEGSLRRWMRQFPQDPVLQPVRVFDAQVDASRLTMVTPDGFRFEDLSMTDAIVLLEKLR